MRVQFNPYLNFQGNTREAMEFYKSVFGGTLDISTYAEVGGMPGVDASESNKVMHAMLRGDNGIVFMAADLPNNMTYKPGTNIQMSLSGDDETLLRSYFDKLSEGGTVQEELAQAPWGDTFGMFTDKFGVSWMVDIIGEANQNK